MKKGFTLSEVMLVLSVIGVIAALTIPGIVQNTQDKMALARLKKEYSTLQQGINSLIANDDFHTAVDGADSGATDVQTVTTLAKYLTVAKNCGLAKGCWYDTPLKYNNGTIYTANADTNFASGQGAKAILADGAMIIINKWGVDCSYLRGDSHLSNTCSFLGIDVNGNTGPNTIGKDYFGFWITSDGLIPQGAFNDTTGSMTCNNGNYETSAGCTAQVLYANKIN